MQYSDADRAEFLRVVLAARPDRLIGLRRELRAWLRNASIGADAQEELILAASEAATNCIDHAYPPGHAGSITVTCWVEPQLLFVEVADDGVWRVPSEASSPGRGFGVTLMHELVDQVRIHHDHHGTRVLLRCRTIEPPRDEGQR